jgi:hypothetical protein
MAEKRPPGFTIPLGFYDGPEVKSIPRRIRAAAVGVWALCGAFSANKLQDGYVDAETLKELCCTDAIRAALKQTKGPDGELDPLWTDARDGGIQFNKWVKYQRSRAEVKAYRKQDAERKKLERLAKKNEIPAEKLERPSGHPPDIDRTVAPLSTKTETETVSSYVPESAYVSNATEHGRGIAATPAAYLVGKTIPSEINSAVQTELRIRAGELLHAGSPPDVVEAALTEWAGRTGIGPGVLASLAADVVKRRNGHARAPNGPNGSKLRNIAELAAAERARENSQADQPKEIT